MTVTHMVLAQFKEGTSTALVEETCKELFKLKDNCIHPDTKKPYMVSIRGGINNSVEGAANGMTHGFIMEFANKEDRDYYALKDETHVQFKQSLLQGGNLAGLTVVDFTDGVIT